MKKYVIERGKHYAKGLHFGITFKKIIKFKCKFDESCLYHFNDIDKYDINKLYGFSTTWFHHKQSGRIGWRCLNGKEIQIVTYSYNNSKRDLGEVDILGTVLPNQEFICTIEDTEKSYVYSFEKIYSPLKTNKIIKNDKKKKDWFIFHYKLMPFFGGNKTAPHDMIIYLEEL